MFTRPTLAIALAATALATPAFAATFDISGTIIRSNAPASPVGRCAALAPPALTIINNNEGANIARGTSNVGDFDLDASECRRPPGPSFDGIFALLFDDGGSLFGTRSSVATPISPGLFSFVGTFLIDGGTGRFGGATGTLTEIATVDFRDPLIVRTNGTFAGVFQVPEPAAMALFGLGALALGGRRARG